MNTDNERPGDPSQDTRAADADRERIAANLKQHFLDGRLTTDEYSDRLDATYAARTIAELRLVVADLPPAPRPAVPQAPPPRRSASPPLFILIALVWSLWLVGWLVGGPPFFLFPIFPLVIGGFFLFRWALWRSRPQR